MEDKANTCCHRSHVWKDLLQQNQSRRFQRELDLLRREWKGEHCPTPPSRSLACPGAGSSNSAAGHRHTGIARSLSPLLWKGCARLPSGFVRPNVVVKGTSVFVGGGSGSSLEISRTVFQYNTDFDKWSNLPLAPQHTFALVVVRDTVTAVGGVSEYSTITSALASFEENTRTWGRKFPAMPTERCASSALATDTHLIVIGGASGKSRSYSNAVEILDLSTFVWSRAAPAIAPMSYMSITLCPARRMLYLTGGLTEQGSVRTIFGCQIDKLLRSRQDCNTTAGRNVTGTVWEIITDAPYVRSGCVAVNGKLVTGSGLDGDQKITNCLHVFSPDVTSWQSLGVMPASRTSCSMAVLDNDRLIVVGGYINPRDWTHSLTTDVIECVNLKL